MTGHLPTSQLNLTCRPDPNREEKEKRKKKLGSKSCRTRGRIFCTLKTKNKEDLHSLPACQVSFV